MWDYLALNFSTKPVIFVGLALFGWLATSYPYMALQHQWRTSIPASVFFRLAQFGPVIILGAFLNAWIFVGIGWAFVAIVSAFLIAMLLSQILGPLVDLVLIGLVVAAGWFLFSRIA